MCFTIFRKLPKEEAMEERGMGNLNFRKKLLNHIGHFVVPGNELLDCFPYLFTLNL